MAQCECVYGLTSLAACINDKIRDVRERNVTIRSETMNYEHPLPRDLGYYRVSDIMEVDITEFRVYTMILFNF